MSPVKKSTLASVLYSTVYFRCASLRARHPEARIEQVLDMRSLRLADIMPLLDMYCQANPYDSINAVPYKNECFYKRNIPIFYRTLCEERNDPVSVSLRSDIPIPRNT